MENVLLNYSEFFNDDGGFKKVIADFDILGERLVSQAQKYKSEINAAFSTLNIDALKKLEEQIESTNTQYKEVTTAKSNLIRVEKEYLDQLKKQEQLEQQLERTKQAKLQTTIKEIQGEKELERAIQAENNTKKSAISLSEAERRARQSAEAQTRKQTGAYYELSAELRRMFSASANVAAEMYKLEEAGEQATPTYHKLASEFTELQKRTITLDAGLKKIDSSLGRNQRRVGDYASGFNGLSNSVNQIFRELPAAAVSLNTFFLGISNNLPIFFDELQKVTAAVKANTAESKANALAALQQAEASAIARGATMKQAVAEGILASETVMATAAQNGQMSVLKQLGKSVFSFNTLLTAGVVALTFWGGKLVELVTTLFDVNAEMRQLNENQETFNKANIEGRKDAQSNILELRKYLSVVKDVSISDEERNIALKALRSQFPFYFKELTDLQILSGDYADEVSRLTLALERQKDVERKSEIAVKNKQQMITLEQERFKIIEDQERITKALNQISANVGSGAGQGAAGLASEQSKLLLRRQEIEELILKLQKDGIENDSAIFQLKKQIIGLEFQEEKSTKDKLLNQVKFVDYLASEFELKKLILENSIKENEETFGSDKFDLSTRLQAQKNLVIQSTALAELERKEALRILKNRYDEERSETIKDNDGKIIGKKYTNEALVQLEKQYTFDVKAVQETFRDDLVQIQKKGEKVQLLSQLDFQQKNLEYLQKNFSETSAQYIAFSKKISAIKTQIENIINQPEGLELSDQIQINNDELKRLSDFRNKIEAQLDNNGKALSNKRRKEILLQIEQFEEEKTDIEADAEVKRQLNRLEAIKKEQESFVEGSNEFKKLELERIDIEKKIQENALKKRLDDEKKANKLSLDNYKDFIKDFNKLLETVLDKLIQLAQKRTDADQLALDNQKEAIDSQRARAEAGLENTLAFEQKIQGKREAELIKSQRREQRLQKIKALYSSYAGYADKDPATAVGKALRDFALLEAITASFGDGGIVGVDGVEKVRTNQSGITQGRSHKSKGGILAFHEGGEGFWSKKEVDSVGHKNFNRIKELATSGSLDSNFFTPQKEAFVRTVVPVVQTDKRLLNEMREVKKAIISRPVEQSGVAEITETYWEMYTKTMKKNNIEIVRRRNKKPRL